MSLPKLPLQIVHCGGDFWYEIVDDDGRFIDGVRAKASPVSNTDRSWPIPDARQAAERRLAELTALIEAETPKCPIEKGRENYDALRPWWCTDRHGARRYWETEAERDAVYDALVALWHKEHGQ